MRTTLVAGLVASMLVACGAVEHGDSVAVQPTVLADSSPRNLNAAVIVSLGGYDVNTRDHALLDVNVMSGGKPVKFVAGEAISCEGRALTAYIGAFEAAFAVADLSGRTVSCTYTWPGGSAGLTFEVPRQLRVVSPREHEQLNRGPATVVRFEAPSGTALFVGTFTATAKAFAQPSLIGPSSARVDTTTLGTGPGTISLRQDLDMAASGDGFHSISGHAGLITMIEVTWV